MSQEQNASGKRCKWEVTPDPRFGWVVKASGDCVDELKQIEANMGPQGWRYLEKRLRQDK